MLEEQYTRSDPGSVPTDRPPQSAVESVPSEQLWRAAILAARQAALSAAELRRAFEAAATSAPSDAPTRAKLIG